MEPYPATAVRPIDRTCARPNNLFGQQDENLDVVEPARALPDGVRSPAPAAAATWQAADRACDRQRRVLAIRSADAA